MRTLKKGGAPNSRSRSRNRRSRSASQGRSINSSGHGYFTGAGKLIPNHRYKLRKLSTCPDAWKPSEKSLLFKGFHTAAQPGTAHAELLWFENGRNKVFESKDCYEYKRMD